MGLLSFLGCSKRDVTSPTRDQQALKTIHYRGGVVRFRIPADWKEEYEADGGGTFFKDVPDSGTFRLSVLTMRSPSEVKSNSAAAILSSLRQASNGVENLPNGSAIIHFVQEVEEHGENISVSYWLLANPLPPDHARIANFSYTILKRQRTDPRFQDELKLLDREVRAVVFASEIGTATE